MINYNSIINETNSNLRKKSADVKIPLSDEDIKTMHEMHDYLVNGYDEEKAQKLNIRPGVGIAAPQINILKKMFVILAYDEHDELHEYGVINPKIFRYSEEMNYLKSGEGCLSVDRSVSGYVHRPKRIQVELDAFDFETNQTFHIKTKLKGYIAIVFQHEYDHLFGTLFIDRINTNNPFFVPSNSSPVQFDFENDDNKEQA